MTLALEVENYTIRENVKNLTVSISVVSFNLTNDDSANVTVRVSTNSTSGTAQGIMFNAWHRLCNVIKVHGHVLITVVKRFLANKSDVGGTSTCCRLTATKAFQTN